MIQDKIFFDEKDPTGLSYNTPFTYYGSYQGRLWSKSPSGSIQYYTQNSDLSAYATTGSNQFSGSQTITGSLTVTGTITGTVAGTTATASYVEYTNVANKPALISGSSQVTYSGLTGIPAGIVSGSEQVTYSGLTGIPSGIVSGSSQIAALGFASTGSSNTFQANQTITGSLFITQNLVVAGSSSIQYISSSVLDIADNIITVNAFNPGVRFGGLAVIDSGSSPQVSGSLLFDSIKDQWIFVHQNQSVVTSSVLLMGPETYNDLGNESYISANRLPKGSGVEHLRDSNITDTGTVVSVNSNTGVTGSLGVTGSMNVVGNVGITLADTPQLLLTHSNTSRTFLMAVDGSNAFFRANSTNNILFQYAGGTTALTINGSTGAATFSSSVDAVGRFGATTNQTTPTDGTAYFYKSSAGAVVSGFQFIAETGGAGSRGTRLTIDNAGAATFSSSVTSPVVKLSDSTLSGAGNFEFTSEAFFGARFQSNAYKFMAGNNSTEYMRITSTGNVGIGSTPTYKLDIRNDVAASTSLEPISLGLYNGNDGGSAIYFRNSVGGQSKISFGVEAVGSGTDDTYLGFSTGGNTALTERMRITSGGNIEVRSANELRVYRSDNARYGTFYTDNSAVNIASSVDPIVISSPERLQFHTAGTERMRITSGGYFKASNNGTYFSSAGSFHELRTNTGNSTSLALTHTSATQPYGLYLYYPSASPNSTNFEFLYCEDSTQSKFIVWSNGSVINRTGSYGTISDIKFKKNVEDATPKLDDILKLKVRNFNLIGDDKKQIGFIAQEFEEVFPSMVDTSIEKETEEEYKSIKTSVLIPMLVKAIQELSAKVETLEAKIQTLEQQ